MKPTVGKPHFSAAYLSHGSVQTEQLFWRFVWVLTLGNETLWLNINYSAQIEGAKWDNLDLGNHCTNHIYIWWLLMCHLRGGDADDDCRMFRSSLTSPIKESFFIRSTDAKWICAKWAVMSDTSNQNVLAGTLITGFIPPNNELITTWTSWPHLQA